MAALHTRPNVLLFITDQQRWDSLGYTGRTACRTPHLDRLAREGVAFDRCITADPICCPARAALFTGRAPHTTGVQNNRQIPLRLPALPEVFRDAGYDVAYSGKWHLGQDRAAAGIERFAGERAGAYRQWLREHNVEDHYPQRQPGFTFQFTGPPEGAEVEGSVEDAGERGGAFGTRTISSPRAAPLEGLSEWTFDSWAASRALEQLERRPTDRPFFHVCSFHGPHPVFVVPEPFFSMYDPAQAPEPANFADPMTDKPACYRRSIWHGAAEAHGTDWGPWRRSQTAYWGYVTLLDELIGRVLGRLETLGLAENTIVVMTTDHGEMMGSHGLFQKSAMFEEALRVPLLVRYPGRAAAGARITAPVSSMDIAPTLLGLTGLTERGNALLEPQGRDLSAWLAGDRAVPAENRGAVDDPASGAVFSEYTPYHGERMTDIRCIVGPRYKLAWNRDDRAELYDTWHDPAELHNAFDDPALAGVRVRLRERLLAWLRETDDALAGEAAAALGR